MMNLTSKTTRDKKMRELKRINCRKVDAYFIAHLAKILAEVGGELSLRTLTNKYKIKAKVAREAACRYPGVFQLSLIRGRLPNAVRLVRE
jgi:hypothetical protein